VNVTGDVTSGDVNLSFSFVANGNVVPPFTSRFAGRLIDSNTLSGVVVGADGYSATSSYRRVR
jgi:hypothetical protein